MNQKITASEYTARRIVEEFGREVLLDEYLFMAAFRDYAPEHKLEAMVLSIALYQNIGTFYVNCTTAASQADAVRKTLTALRPVLAEGMILAVVQILFYALGWDPAIIRQALAPQPPPETSPAPAAPPEQKSPALRDLHVPPVNRFGCSITMIGKEPHAPRAYDCTEASLRHSEKAELLVSDPSPNMGCGQLQVRVYRFSDYGIPVTPVLRQNFSGKKVSLTIDLAGQQWEDDHYVILAVIKPPFDNAAEEAAYDAQHPEAVLPPAYMKHDNYAAHFFVKHLRLAGQYYEEIRFLSDAKPLQFREGWLRTVPVFEIGERYSFQIISWQKMKKTKRTCAYIRITDPSGQLVENLKREITIEANNDRCQIPVEHVPAVGGTYTYEVSLYGSNTVTGEFTVS